MTDETVNTRVVKILQIQTALIAGILILLLAVGAFLVLQVNTAMEQVKALDLDKINATVSSLQATAADLENLDMDVINEAVASLKGAAENLAKTDMGAINDGIKALSAAASNLETLDVEQLNSLIQSLESVAAQMEKTTSTFNKLFGR